MDDGERLTIGRFGDARRAEAGLFLVERIATIGSLVVRRLGGDRGGELSIHRFLSSPAVTQAEIIATVSARTAAACSGRRVVAVQDTTEIDFTGRDRRRQGLGPNANGGLGFFLHPVIAVDRDSEAVLGVVDAQIWTRASEPPSVHRNGRPVAVKESYRWLAGTQAAAARLAQATSVVVVTDREGDLYAQFARRPADVDLLIRAEHDRCLAGGGKLFAAPAGWPELGRIKVNVAPRKPGELGRTATVALRAGTAAIKQPATARDGRDPATLTLTVVEAREVGEPSGEPLLWRLLTTLTVASLADAEEVIGLYRLRWRIEQVFRALKSDGLNLQEVQMQKAERLFKLAVVGLIAAVRTLQLVDARDGSSRPATDVIDHELIEAAAAIGRTKQGATPRQQNPYMARSLAWLAWIIARLGGWNCYYKPPGPKTMRAGWNHFAAMAAGFTIAQLEGARDAPPSIDNAFAPQHLRIP